MNCGWIKKKLTLFIFYLDVYFISKKSSTCNYWVIVKYIFFITLDNMTYVNPNANALICISTSTLDELIAPWDLWPVMAYANASGKVNL